MTDKTQQAVEALREALKTTGKESSSPFDWIDWAGPVVEAALDLLAALQAEGREAVAWLVERERDPTYPEVYVSEAKADRAVASVTLPPFATKRPLVHPQPTASSEAGQDAVHVVFDGPPSHEAPRFVECETPNGRGYCAGEWRDRGDGFWELVIPLASKQPTDTPCSKASDCTTPALCASAGTCKGRYVLPKQVRAEFDARKQPTDTERDAARWRFGRDRGFPIRGYFGKPDGGPEWGICVRAGVTHKGSTPEDAIDAAMDKGEG